MLHKTISRYLLVITPTRAKGHFDGYPLWIAHYYQEELKLTEGTNWWFWQHSDIARVNGINHAVDFNAFKGDSLDFQRLLVH
ncbi:MAG: GH25 family lysozyme [Bacteroidota bacterium]